MRVLLILLQTAQAGYSCYLLDRRVSNPWYHLGLKSYFIYYPCFSTIEFELSRLNTLNMYVVHFLYRKGYLSWRIS